jgi:hypothetical protein
MKALAFLSLLSLCGCAMDPQAQERLHRVAIALQDISDRYDYNRQLYWQTHPVITVHQDVDINVSGTVSTLSH